MDIRKYEEFIVEHLNMKNINEYSFYQDVNYELEKINMYNLPLPNIHEDSPEIGILKSLEIIKKYEGRNMEIEIGNNVCTFYISEGKAYCEEDCDNYFRIQLSKKELIKINDKLRIMAEAVI